MQDSKPVRSALISVYYKDGLEEMIRLLNKFDVAIYSTGGTQKFIESLGASVTPVEQLTEYPSILGGRVKTLHPHVFGGILARRDFEDDMQTLERYGIPEIDLVVVDLYPFEETVASGASQQDVIEKIDIGGVSLIRAAAKNFNDVMVCCDKSDYNALVDVLTKQNATTTLAQRKHHAGKAFATTAKYDSLIASYFGNVSSTKPVPRGATAGFSNEHRTPLRYGENPHQKGFYVGNLNDVFEQLHGKELSYNNILDCDAALQLIKEFEQPTYAVIKHNNACGVASDNDLAAAWKKALAGDPVSAFGGIVVTNRNVTADVAKAIDEVFIEVMIAPSYDADALDILKKKKNRIVLKSKPYHQGVTQIRSALNGMLEQDYDTVVSTKASLKVVTETTPTDAQLEELLFAEKICKHLKSNAIVLSRGKQLLGMGCGQTSRIDALKGAINKAEGFGFNLKDCVMASDAFFPFPDCVTIASQVGVNAIVQPGGSVKDQDSIDAANKLNIAMVFSGLRHFRH